MRLRARSVGVMLGSLETSKYNAITDVEGVEVGHVTLIQGEGPLKPGEGPVRTGVTAVLPHGDNIFKEKVRAGAFVLNGFGKSTGLMQLFEFGTIETPILLTNTLNVGGVMDALTGYMLDENDDIGVTTGSVNPIVCECNDSYLNDIRGRHVKEEHVHEAIRKAKSGKVEEGAVGAGTGMTCHGFKGGIGTSSRIVPSGHGDFTLGVLVLSNHGRREELTIKGVPVGRELRGSNPYDNEDGSIIVVMATDAPLNSRQLCRLAKRGTHGIARVGSFTSSGSGDIMIAFSTRNKVLHYPEAPVLTETALTDYQMDSLFLAAVEATEEAIVNSLFKAETTVGRDGNISYELPTERVLEILKKHRVL